MPIFKIEHDMDFIENLRAGGNDVRVCQGMVIGALNEDDASAYAAEYCLLIGKDLSKVTLSNHMDIDQGIPMAMTLKKIMEAIKPYDGVNKEIYQDKYDQACENIQLQHKSSALHRVIEYGTWKRNISTQKVGRPSSADQGRPQQNSRSGVIPAG